MRPFEARCRRLKSRERQDPVTPPAAPAALVAAFGALVLLAACAGPGNIDPAYRGRDFAGRSLALAALDTASLSVTDPDDVIRALPSEGVISARRILAESFQARFREALRWRLGGSGVSLATAGAAPAGPTAQPATAAAALPASADTASLAGVPADTARAADPAAAAPASPPAPAAAAPRPDFTLRLDSLAAPRTRTTTLMPKVGNIPRNPLHLTGSYVLWDEAAGRAAAAGRFRALVTNRPEAGPEDWRRAFDEAARQVAEGMPF